MPSTGAAPSPGVSVIASHSLRFHIVCNSRGQLCTWRPLPYQRPSSYLRPTYVPCPSHAEGQAYHVNRAPNGYRKPAGTGRSAPAASAETMTDDDYLEAPRSWEVG